MRELYIGVNDAGQRLDKFIMKTFRTMPQSLMYRYIRQKKIKVNGARADVGQMLAKGDTVRLYIPEEFFSSEKSSEYSFMKLTPRVDVVYEDENILLAEKPVGMLVHSDDEQLCDTLIDHIKAYLYKKGEYDPGNENSFAPALCNRIDRNTGGIVIAAKNAESLRIINEKIRCNELTKRYLCCTHGYFDEKQATLHGWLIKDSDKNTVSVFRKKPAYGNSKEIITKYRVLKESGGLSLVEVELVTGRTHQIRAHFAFAGHPLLGDGKYGVNRDDKKIGYSSQALYSYKLTFDPCEKKGLLSYLDGMTFKVKPEHIAFLKYFDK